MSLSKLVLTVLFMLVLIGCSTTHQPDGFRGQTPTADCGNVRQTEGLIGHADPQGLVGIAEPQGEGLRGLVQPRQCVDEVNTSYDRVQGLAQALPRP